MSKNVLVIDGNPKQISFCSELANNYVMTCENKNNVKLVSLSQLDFNINLANGYDNKQSLEPDLEKFQKMLKWANHVVIIAPVWWGGMPAKLKGLIDRTFLPGFAFMYTEGKSTPKKLLKGRTAEVVLTMDTPPLYYRIIQGNPAFRQLKRTILGFCGFEKISAIYIGPVLNSTDKQRLNWIKRVIKSASKI